MAVIMWLYSQGSPESGDGGVRSSAKRSPQRAGSSQSARNAGRQSGAIGGVGIGVPSRGKRVGIGSADGGVGGERFLMWQSATWNGVETAFRLGVILGAVLVYLVQPDGDGNARPGA
jgi:hypothetical protein